MRYIDGRGNESDSHISACFHAISVPGYVTHKMHECVQIGYDTLTTCLTVTSLSIKVCRKPCRHSSRNSIETSIPGNETANKHHLRNL